MSDYEKQIIIQKLTDDWGGYIHNFENLSKKEQDLFLEKQGYKRFSDLLAHLMQWWELGMQNIIEFGKDADYTAPPVDVDEFNARAVSQFAKFSEEEVRVAFEKNRSMFIQFIDQLSLEVLHDARVQRQLEMELFGHYKEHAIG